MITFDVFDTVTLTYVARGLSSFDAARALFKKGREVWEYAPDGSPSAQYYWTPDGVGMAYYEDGKWSTQQTADAHKRATEAF